MLEGVSNFPTPRGRASYIQQCHRDDPKVGECVVKNVEAMRPKFSEGIPELGIPSLNPLVIPAASLNSGSNFKADFTNLKVYGADIFAHASTDGKKYDKNGKTYMGFTNPEVNGLVVKKAHFQFDNIFGDNEQLNVQTNQVLNDSAEELIKELSSVITSVTRDIVFASFIEVCHRNDPQINSCLQRNTELIRPRLKNGIPEMHIPSFNPLVISQATLNGGVNFEATFNNVREKFRFEIDIHFDRLRITSDYKINGRLLVLQLNGEGPADGNYTNVKAHLTTDGEHYQKNGKDHVRFVDKKIDLSIGNSQLYFGHILGDNEELNVQTNRIINENSQEIIKELTPVITKVIGEFVFGIVNSIFERYSYDDLFPQ
nr:unnamed protein product [Callosobruchus chinensis]